MNSAHNAAALHWFVTNTADISSFGEGPARLLGLIRAHAKRTGRAWPACATMARELAVSRSTIHRWLSQLRRAGAVDVRRTGRGSVYVPIAAGAEAAPLRHQMSQSDTSEPAAIDMVRKAQEQVVVTARPPAETETAGLTTTPTMAGEEEVPDLVTVRQDLAEARDRATEWQNADPQAPETAQSRQRVAALQQQLAHVDDVRRAQEAVRQVPALESRGGARAASERNLWRLRRAYATMAGDDWRRSVLRWCAWHRRHAHRRLGDLDGWLARERFEPITPPGEPPPLPEPPPAAASDTASNSDSVTIYQCAIALGACQFIRMVVPAGERPPERCSRCGGHVKVAGIPDIVSA